MTILEQFSLFQRIAASIRTDIEEGKANDENGIQNRIEQRRRLKRLEYRLPKAALGGRQTQPVYL